MKYIMFGCVLASLGIVMLVEILMSNVEQSKKAEGRKLPFKLTTAYLTLAASFCLIGGIIIIIDNFILEYFQ